MPVIPPFCQRDGRAVTAQLASEGREEREGFTCLNRPLAHGDLLKILDDMAAISFCSWTAITPPQRAGSRSSAGEVGSCAARAILSVATDSFIDHPLERMGSRTIP